MQRIDARGNLPAWVANRKIKDSLSTPSELHEAFARDDEIDFEERSRLTRIMENPASETYSGHELASIETIQDLATEAEK